MRTLVAIFTCHQYDYKHPQFVDWFKRPTADRVSALRDTWLKDVAASGTDYKLFYGRPPQKKKIVDARIVIDRDFRAPEKDEIFLECGDDYYSSGQKIRGVINYALDNGYDRLCKIDDDVYVYWDRLAKNAPTKWTGGGKPNTPAGPCYWLMRGDMQTVRENGANHWAEDAMVGTILLNQNRVPTFDERYYIAPQTQHNQYITDEELALPNNYLTIHSLSPAQMRKHYEEEQCKKSVVSPVPASALAPLSTTTLPSMTFPLVSLGTMGSISETQASSKFSTSASQDLSSISSIDSSPTVPSTISSSDLTSESSNSPTPASSRKVRVRGSRVSGDKKTLGTSDGETQ